MTETKEEYYLMKDSVVKSLFTNPKVGKKYSAEVIANTIGIPYEEVYNNLEYLHPKPGLNQNIIDNKTDTLYETGKIIINIEFNKTTLGSKTQIKNEAYIYTLYLRQLTNSKKYSELKPIIQINIDGFDYFKKNKFLYKSILMETNLHIVDNENIQIYHINLDYLRKLGYTKVEKEKNRLEELLYILVSGSVEEAKKIYSKDKLMMEVIGEMERNTDFLDQFFFYNKEELEKADREEAIEEGFEEGFEEGKQQGFEKGKQENRIEIAKNLLSSNLSLEEISKYTGLSVSEINKLKEEI